MKDYLLTLFKIEFISRHLLPALGAVLVAYFLGKWVRILMRRIIHRWPDVDLSVEKLLANCVSWIVYLAGTVAALSFLGVNTTGLLATVSAIGLAIGIALRDTLGNVAAGLQIIFLHPFHTGDYIQGGGTAGTVEEIGLFATRLKTFDGLFVCMPNSLLCNTPLTNFSRNATRRLDVSVGISYSDSIDAGLRALLETASAEKRLLTDPPPRAFVAKLDESSVVLTLRSWVARENYFDVLFDLTRDLKLAIESAGLTIPFPQRDVHLDGAALPPK